MVITHVSDSIPLLIITGPLNEYIDFVQKSKAWETDRKPTDLTPTLPGWPCDFKVLLIPTLLFWGLLFHEVLKLPGVSVDSKTMANKSTPYFLSKETINTGS